MFSNPLAFEFKQIIGSYWYKIYQKAILNNNYCLLISRRRNKLKLSSLRIKISLELTPLEVIKIAVRRLVMSTGLSGIIATTDIGTSINYATNKPRNFCNNNNRYKCKHWRGSSRAAVQNRGRPADQHITSHHLGRQLNWPGAVKVCRFMIAI